MIDVLILTTRHDCDDNRVYQKEVISLANNGFHVLYMAPNNVERDHKNITYLSVLKSDSLFKRYLNMKTIYKRVVSLNPRVVHIQDVELLPLLLKIKKKNRNIITIYDVHEDYRSQMLTKQSIPRFLRKFLSSRISKIESKANSIVDAIICADNFTVNYFSNKHSVVIYNFPKIADYDLSLAEKDILKRNKYDLIFPGSMRVFTYKAIVNIVKLCLNRGVSLKTCIISPFKVPGGKESVKQFIFDNNVPFELFDLVDQVPPTKVQEYLRESKIGLLPLPDTPKLQKNISTKMFEYMIEFLPIVGSDLCPERQFVNDGETGFLVPYNNFEEYANKILYLLSSPQEANRMGIVGNNLVLTRYSWENEEKKLIELYNRLLKNE